MTNVHAKVLVGENIITLSNNKPPEGPVACTDRKFTTARIFNFL
jgi:hypothetical protein